MQIRRTNLVGQNIGLFDSRNAECGSVRKWLGEDIIEEERRRPSEASAAGYMDIPRLPASPIPWMSEAGEAQYPKKSPPLLLQLAIIRIPLYTIDSSILWPQ
ncbi:hypothetical protein GJ744_007936 [Endocarpon pusillum]|uniref:Uncharacterized protein n=1 Tax=Endocarpon pusillum TaxID=364733 RepID=A0A8H7AM17_9EURO|nr:hypothetical protein GJ744_007936 [Endocarpon pusillum]